MLEVSLLSKPYRAGEVSTYSLSLAGAEYIQPLHLDVPNLSD